MRRLLLLLAFLVSGTALAQDYPNRRITIVVPYTAGGSSDFVARTVAAKMQDGRTARAATRTSARSSSRSPRPTGTPCSSRA
jgi:tripartite-type tricarboxylate transporter receptor subunit TctC